MRLHIFTGILLIVFIHASTAASRQHDRIIVTSFYPLYIMTINMAGDIPGIKVVNLTKPYTGCLHDYQLTPREMVTVSGAWVLVTNGGGMESFLEKVTRQYPDIPQIEASKGINFISENPHVWVSISGARAQVKNICAGLIQLDSAHAAQYKKNCDRYCLQLEALQSKMHLALDSLPHRSIITFHEAFPYFAQEFNLTIVSVIEREPGSEPSAAELAKTITLVKKHNAPPIFVEPQYPAKAAEVIARETGAKIYTLDPAVSGDLAADAYLKTMEANCSTLIEALK